MSTKHAYPGKTTNAIIALKVLSLNFSGQISELSKARKNWTPEYAANLDQKVDNVSEAILGAKTRVELFSATSTLNKLVIPVKDDLVTIKRNLEVDFKDNKTRLNEILTKLGYNNGASIWEKTQPELVEQLMTFKRELTPELLSEITAKGMNEEVPQRIVANADTFSRANAVQEKLKISTKEATGNLVTELNNLYEEVISICKIAADYYKRDAVKKEMFTFSKIMKNIGEPRQEKKETTETSKS